jgi:phage host-nuclease inhibitor protein Gam
MPWAVFEGLTEWYIGKRDRQRFADNLEIASRLVGDLTIETQRLASEVERLGGVNKSLQAENASLKSEIDELKRR